LVSNMVILKAINVKLAKIKNLNLTTVKTDIVPEHIYPRQR
jgi:hypothetical protein